MGMEKLTATACNHQWEVDGEGWYSRGHNVVESCRYCSECGASMSEMYVLTQAVIFYDFDVPYEDALENREGLAALAPEKRVVKQTKEKRKMRSLK